MIEDNESGSVVPSGGTGKLELSLGALVSGCMDGVRQNLGASILLTLVYIVPLIISGGLFGAAGLISDKGEPSFDDVNWTLVMIGVGVMLASLILAIRVSASLTNLALQYFDRGTKMSVGQAWSEGGQYAVKYFMTSLALSLVVLGGMVLVIVPGILFALWYSLAVDDTVYRKSSIKEAFAESKRLTENHRLWILGVGVLFGVVSTILDRIPLVNLLSSILFALLGAFFGPYIYLALKHKKDGLAASATTAQ